ncbi:hypothetical protein [Aureibacter tunicatorum]|uniref:Uncharacterized protein n=1 Tax=Aureibacter tunicatorum TaxID=866807 RepID=A0AAE4BUJ3_9BACT|nr:hypothetical protein [Aureibacter tunicatorum]MDR6240823.1 hypothetical protein [Aureibacter tunicatorum]BDD06844.1 hypothetical protein AUTU_43270 [Aureibacter tunicatorum]
MKDNIVLILKSMLMYAFTTGIAMMIMNFMGLAITAMLLAFTAYPLMFIYCTWFAHKFYEKRTDSKIDFEIETSLMSKYMSVEILFSGIGYLISTWLFDPYLLAFLWFVIHLVMTLVKYLAIFKNIERQKNEIYQ